MEKYISFILIIFVLIINIIAMLGMFYLTKFSFESSNLDNKRTITLTDTELMFTKVAVILFWISFFVTLSHNLYLHFDNIKIDF
jgi:hypothetical protein